MNPKAWFRLLKSTFSEWSADKAPRLGAALAYYSVFSIGPLVLLVVGAASMIFGAEAAQGKVVQEIRGTIGEPAAKAVEDMLVQGKQNGTGLAATIIGIVILLFGAADVFGQLQDAIYRRLC